MISVYRQRYSSTMAILIGAILGLRTARVTVHNGAATTSRPSDELLKEVAAVLDSR